MEVLRYLHWASAGPTALAAVAPVVPAAVPKAARVARHAPGGRPGSPGPAAGLAGCRRGVGPALRLRLYLFPEVLRARARLSEPIWEFRAVLQSIV